MTLDEKIKHCEEVAEAEERSAKLHQRPDRGVKGSGKRYLNCLECAREHRQTAEWLKELKRLRTEHEARANKESARYVFDELLKCSLFRGVYDARNGKEDFMYGVCTVMENIALMISEEAHDKFDTEFMVNMSKSMEVNADEDND